MSTKAITPESINLKHVPTRPGVYLFKDDTGKIIYIGKAKNLRNRVRSYFQKNKYQTAKNQSLIKRIADLEWITVGSEVEALLTEANLIKQHKPRYNIDLKDDKSFPFIRITNEPYPQVFLTRDIEKDGSRYFGPYTDVFLLKQSLKALHKLFPIRSCSYQIDDEVIAQGKIKVCLDYHIKKCEGPCEGLVSQETYDAMIGRVIQFLKGDTRETEEFIRNQMELAARELRYEDAGKYRDQLEAIDSFKKRQKKVAADFADRDVFALAREDGMGVCVIVRIRQGRLFGREKISFEGDEEDGDILSTLITQFYMDTDHIPADISLPADPDDSEELQTWLREKRKGAVRFHQPQRGEKARELRIAYQNARLLLGEWIINKKKRKDYVPKSVNRLQTDLELKAPPRRIEAFDISHLGGTNTVASLVTFLDGKPRKSDYRKFKVKTVDGIDDFAAMREVVYRRYKRLQEEEQVLPDLILIDGGKGQLSMAVSALRELGMDYLPVVGLAKRLEEVFMPGQSAPQSIAKQSPGLIFLRRIRDEAHRFAITFQRQKRKTSVSKSIFHEVPGMGVKRVKVLLDAYDSIQSIAATTADDLKLRTGFPDTVCRDVISRAQKFINDSNS